MLILLADDERLVRLGLQSMLEELYPGQHTYLHARNGTEVVQLLNSQSPDVAFLDVKMPLMNGLEALKTCRQVSPHTVWVILSGYADFTYAQQAISLSAFDYLLKPVELDTLRNLFSRIALYREKDRRQILASFSHDVVRSFSMADQFSQEDTDFLPAGSSDYIFYEFYIDFLNSSLQKKIKQKLQDNLNRFCFENSSIVSYCLFFNTDGNLCLVADVPDASRLTHYIKLQAEGLPANAYSVFWGNNKKISGIYEISRRIARVADIRLIRDFSDPAFIKNVEVLPGLPSLLSFARALTSTLNFYLEQDLPAFRKSLEALKNSQEFLKIFTYVDLPVLQNYLSGIFNSPVSLFTYEDLLAFLEKKGCQQVPGSEQTAVTDVNQIKAFIRLHYPEDVSMSRVSEEFGLSPTYLSRLFHEKTGQKYIDYVILVRMEAARALLKENPELSVRQAAEAVGYSSVRHFSKTFQKYTGMLPSDYAG